MCIRDRLCIGDLKNGFDLENAKKILNVAKITEKECRAVSYTHLNNSNFYSVHCRCTGAYKENNLWQDFKAVTVINDP